MMIGVDGMRMEVTLWEPRGEETLPRNDPQDHPSLITTGRKDKGWEMPKNVIKFYSNYTQISTMSWFFGWKKGLFKIEGFFQEFLGFQII